MCCYVNNETASIQYSKVLILHRILVLHNHNRSHTLQFLLRPNIDEPKETGLCISIWVILIYIVSKFSVNLWSMITWLWHEAVPSFSVLTSLMSLCFWTAKNYSQELQWNLFFFHLFLFFKFWKRHKCNWKQSYSYKICRMLIM